MAHQKTSHFTVLGDVQSGDFADLTTYKDQRGHVVWFTKTWPEKPPTWKQTIDRTNFANAVSNWHLLTTAQRAQWTLAARRASLCMSGFNLYVYCWLGHDKGRIHTIAHQTQTTLTCTCGVSGS